MKEDAGGRVRLGPLPREWGSCLTQSLTLIPSIPSSEDPCAGRWSQILPLSPPRNGAGALGPGWETEAAFTLLLVQRERGANQDVFAERGKKEGPSAGLQVGVPAFFEV